MSPVARVTKARVCQKDLVNVVRRNLTKIATTCYAKGITISLGTLIFGLIVYSAVCPDSGTTFENALESTFNKASNTHSWSKVGVVPFTKKYL